MSFAICCRQIQDLHFSCCQILVWVFLNNTLLLINMFMMVADTAYIYMDCYTLILSCGIYSMCLPKKFLLMTGRWHYQRSMQKMVQKSHPLSFLSTRCLKDNMYLNSLCRTFQSPENLTSYWTQNSIVYNAVSLLDFKKWRTFLKGNSLIFFHPYVCTKRTSLHTFLH